MNNETHTPGPWRTVDSRSNFDAGRIPIRDGANKTVGWAAKGQFANARRIVACVNACAGVPIEELEKLADITQDDIPGAHGVALMAITNIDLSEVNDEFAEALRDALDAHDMDQDPTKSWAVKARAALAKLK